MLRRKGGFTLIEVLIVVAIIGVLVLLASLYLSNKTQDAREGVIVQGVGEVQKQIGVEEVSEGVNFLSWALVDKESIEEAINSGRFYSERGLVESFDGLAYKSSYIATAIKRDLVNKEFRVVPEEYSKNAGVNFEGIFYSDQNFNVYFYDSDLNAKSNSIKSATVLPYSLWDIPMVEKKVEDFGLNTVNLGVRVDIDNINADNMVLNEGDLNHAVNLARKLKEKDVKIMIEPFPWIAEGSIGETELNPDNVDNWFWRWNQDILKPILDRFKEENIEVDYFNVASNFVNLEYAHGYWSNTFKGIKDSYEVQTIYKTNWWITAEWDESTKEIYNTKVNSPLFQDPNLDIISIASYFELTSEEEPTLNELMDALKSTTVHGRGQNVYEEIKGVANSNGKQVLFGELGVPRVKGYATKPWDNFDSTEIVKDAQYNYFKAYMDTFWEEDWVKGFSVFAIGDTSSYYDIVDSKAIKYLNKLK